MRFPCAGTKLILSLLAAGLLLAGSAAPGTSQSRKGGTQGTAGIASGPASGPEGTSEDKAPRKSIRMEELEIVGEVEKPKAMFVIPMAPLEYRRGNHRKDFTAEILTPIDREALENLEKALPSEGQP